MEITDKIQNEVIRLLEDNNFNDLNVSIICNNLKITRQSFYYHYESMYDIIYAIYLNNPIQLKSNDSLEKIIKSVIKYLESDFKFNSKIYESDSKEVLINIIDSFLFKSISSYLKSINLKSNIISSLSRMLSSFISNEILIGFFINKNKNIDKDIIKIISILNEEELKAFLFN